LVYGASDSWSDTGIDFACLGNEVSNVNDTASFYMETAPLFKELAQLAEASSNTGNDTGLKIAQGTKQHILEAIGKIKSVLGASAITKPKGKIVSCSQAIHDTTEPKHKKQRRT
jgi:hypothetical protein